MRLWWFFGEMISPSAKACPLAVAIGAFLLRIHRMELRFLRGGGGAADSVSDTPRFDELSG